VGRAEGCDWRFHGEGEEAEAELPAAGRAAIVAALKRRWAAKRAEAATKKPTTEAA